MKLVIRPCSRADLREIKVQDAQTGQFLEPSVSSHFSDDVLHLYGRTFLLGGKPVGALGAYPMWPGFALGWGLISEDALARPKEFCRLARAQVDRTHDLMGPRRLEISVDSRHTSGLRWAKFLGFKEEGLMACYGPLGEDHVRFARVWP